MTLRNHMNSSEIHNKIVFVADKYGSRNPQQFKQLKQLLSKCNKEDVFSGCYSVFLEENEGYFERQQLAGRLLYALKPKLELNLKNVVRKCLNTYNLSIEELPWYLRDLVGKERLLSIIKELEECGLSDREQISLRTFQFWLGFDSVSKMAYKSKNIHALQKYQNQ